MKKVNKVFSLFLAVLVLLLSSCVSIPKEVKDDSTLCMGMFKIEAEGYDYIAVNGNIKYTVEITIEDSVTGKSYSTYVDKNNFYCFANLPAGHSFFVTQIMIRDSNGGSVWLNNPGFVPFSPITKKIINLGYVYIKFDGKKNWANWNLVDNSSVVVEFKKLNAKTMWYNYQVLDYPLVR